MLQKVTTALGITLLYEVKKAKAIIAGYCGKPTSVVIPPEIDGLPVVGVKDLAFYYCDALKTLDLPATIETIGRQAFEGCGSLDAIKLREGLKSVGAFAFDECPNLKRVVLPETVRSVGVCAFGSAKKVVGLDRVAEHEAKRARNNERELLGGI